MFPNFSRYDRHNVGRTHAEILASWVYVPPCLCRSRNAKNLLWCELCWLSVFLHHVIDVVLLRAQEQMCRINASWIVTLVANEQAIWDRPMRYCVANVTCRMSRRVYQF